MAAQYLKAIRSIQPRGPYFLGGWSFGGNVAMEMTSQLEAEGQDEVRLVALVDSRPFTHPRVVAFIKTMNEDSASILSLIARHFAQMTGKPAPVTYHELRNLPHASRADYLLAAVERTSMFPRDLAASFVRRFIQDFAASTRVINQYRQAGSVRASVALLRATEVSNYYEGFPAMEESLSESSDPTYGWSDFATRPVMVMPIGGTHETCVFPPNTHSLVTALLKCK